MGEPAGSRRLTEEQNTADEPGQIVPPPRARRARPPAHPRVAGEAGDEAADDRTSPFPYSENFNEWVADEAAARDEPKEGEAKENKDAPRRQTRLRRPRP